MKKGKYYILGLILFCAFIIYSSLDTSGTLNIDCSQIGELEITERIRSKAHAKILHQIKFDSSDNQIVLNGSIETGIFKTYADLKRCDDKLEIEYKKSYYTFSLKKIYVL